MRSRSLFRGWFSFLGGGSSSRPYRTRRPFARNGPRGYHFASLSVHPGLVSVPPYGRKRAKRSGLTVATAGGKRAKHSRLTVVATGGGRAGLIRGPARSPG